MDAFAVVETLDHLLRQRLSADTYDLAADDDGGIELLTDEWTLVIEEWPNGSAFVAFDDEPTTDKPDDLATFLRESLPQYLDALRELNASAGGQLAAMLARPADPLSNALATLLG